MNKFKIGQKVTWTSSSNGSTTAKVGTIEIVVAAEKYPTEAQRKEAGAYGYVRNHESYMVRVPGKTDRSKGKLYWPIANKLQSI